MSWLARICAQVISEVWDQMGQNLVWTFENRTLGKNAKYVVENKAMNHIKDTTLRYI